MHFHTPQDPWYAGLETQVREQLFRVNIQSKTTVIIPLCHYIVSYFTKKTTNGIFTRDLLQISWLWVTIIKVLYSFLCLAIVLICRRHILENVNVVKGSGPIIHLGSVLFVAISWINRTLLYYMKTYIDRY